MERVDLHFAIGRESQSADSMSLPPGEAGGRWAGMRFGHQVACACHWALDDRLCQHAEISDHHARGLLLHQLVENLRVKWCDDAMV